ncbi:hypothetical protein TCDM_06216 [Trypanosoma cruzi Dm28c]|uniref:Ig-like domain-containing protein n=1 Tax=Trypanosoma cruzi Dm28c TaxID=1416333 RepID=V5AX28_TRYCR|nr:hypothetical protein TCDM_06216 [Trypanosoma cruzi Dm28c]
MSGLPVNGASSGGSSRGETTHFRVKLGNIPNPASSTTLERASKTEKVHSFPSSSSLNSSETTLTAVDFCTWASMANAMSCAYTSSGYPTFLTTNSIRSDIYGAFVELRIPSLHSMTLPPEETLVVVPPIPQSCNDTMNASCASASTLPCRVTGTGGPSRPLVLVVWKRGSHLFSTHPATVAALSPSTKSLSVNSPKTPSYLVRLRSNSSSSSKNTRSSPSAIDNVQTSSRLNEIFFGLPPTVPTKSSSVQKNGVADGFAPNINDVTPPRNEGDEAETQAGNSVRRPPPSSPPPEEPPIEGVPVQLTLVTAGSFNHLTTYAVRHQEGKVLAAVPLQTIVASSSMRRITAHCPFLLGMDVSENYVAPALLTEGERNVLHKEELKQPRKQFMSFKSTKSSERAKAEGLELRFEEIQVEGVISDGKNAVSVVSQCVAVEPFILIGNHNGDLLLFSIFEGKILQRLNFSGTVKGGTGGDSTSATCNQLVSAPVSCITEVECGIEKRLALVVDCARLCRARGENSFTIPYVTTQGGPPSVFAVGFGNGHVLIVCVTVEGAWISKHFSSFGHRLVQAISMRVPHFLTRLWPNDAEASFASHETRQRKGFFPAMTVCVSAESLVVDGESSLAAVSCDGGTIRLVKASEMEVELCHVTALENHSVGDFLAVQWVPSHADATLYPDLLVVTNEDDSITVCQVAYLSDGRKNGDCTVVRDQNTSLAEDSELLFSPPSVSYPANSQAVREEFVHVTRRLFHRSWVGDLCALPIPSRGHLLVATSYDSRSSFWPLFFSDASLSVDARNNPLEACSLESFLQECFSGCLIHDKNAASFASQWADNVIPVEPVFAVALHADPTVRCAACGAGRSYFFVSLCLRGRVKFWEVRPVVD